MTDNTPRKVVRKKSASRRVSYSDPVPVRTGKSTYLEVLPQFVPRSAGPDEFAPKLMYWKKSAGKFRSGFPAEFTLSHDEAVQLRNILNDGLGVAESASDGSLLIIPLGAGEQADLESHDLSTVGATLAQLLAKDDLLSAARSATTSRMAVDSLEESLRLAQLRDAAVDLESRLDNGEVLESVYQEWCEKHAWAFGCAYVSRDEVRTIAVGDSLDILVEQTANGLRDIFELKRPNMKVILWDNTHKSWYWSSETSKAIGQCHRYLDALHEAAGAGLRDHPEIMAYHPRATVVIGRSHDWDHNRQRGLHGLNARLHGVQVITFDHLLAQAKQMLHVLGAGGHASAPGSMGSEHSSSGENE